MGSHPRRRLRRWIAPALVAMTALAAVPASASAAPSSYDRLANITPASVGSGGLRLGNIQLVRGVTITGVRLNLNGSRVRAAANLKLGCAAGGDITVGGAGDINFFSSRNWAVTLKASTGARGCQLAREFVIGPNADVQATLRAQDGVLYIVLDAKASLKTTIIPGISQIDADAHIGIGGGAYDIDVTGGIPGLSVHGAIASNGTYALGLDLEGLQLGGAKIGAHVSLKRTSTSGTPQVAIAASLGTNLQILPGLHLLSVKLGLDNSSITIEGTIRVACERGFVDATAVGRIQDLRNFSLNVKGVTSPAACGFGNFIRLRGDALAGTIAVQNGALILDADVAVENVNLGWLPLTRNDAIGVSVENVQAHIGNVTAGGPGNQLVLDLAGKGVIGVKLGFLPRTITVGAGVKIGFAIDTTSFALKRLNFALTSLSLGTVPKSYAPLIESAIGAALDDVATTPPSPAGVTASLTGAPLPTA